MTPAVALLGIGMGWRLRRVAALGFIVALGAERAGLVSGFVAWGAPAGAGAPSPHAPTAVPGGGAAGGSGADAKARDIYAATCVSCHGPNGHGDGLAAAGLPKRPANFADPAWQSAIADDEIDRAIVGGGAAVGKSPLMPANPDLADKPEVVDALRALVRGFASPAGAAKR
ncbi:MAG TPA: cytochrome c [Candidatus Binatia bacterium]|nr:cytochrome c [Candidatus Binatia bacterium]